jgi:hypothetical protein
MNLGKSKYVSILVKYYADYERNFRGLKKLDGIFKGVLT